MLALPSESITQPSSDIQKRGLARISTVPSGYFFKTLMVPLTGTFLGAHMDSTFWMSSCSSLLERPPLEASSLGGSARAGAMEQKTKRIVVKRKYRLMASPDPLGKGTYHPNMTIQ